MREHPKSQHSADARERITALRADDARRQAEIERAKALALAAAAERHATIALERDTRDFEAARALDTLTAWEDFIRRASRSPHRAEAGRRIEELASHPDVDRVRARVAPREAERPRDKTWFYIVDMELAAPGENDHFLVKDRNYDYVSVDQSGVHAADSAFERPILRYTRPFEVVIHCIARDTLLLEDAELHQVITRNYFHLVQHAGLDFMSTELITCWPRDVEAFKIDEHADPPKVSVRRGYLANALGAAELGGLLDRLSDEDCLWAVNRLQVLPWEPASLREEIVDCLARDRLDCQCLGAEALPELVDLFTTGRPRMRVQAATVLASLDRSGEIFERCRANASRKEADAQYAALSEAIRRAPSCARLFTSDTAVSARDAVRDQLLVDFRGEDAAARHAAQVLENFGWDPYLPANHVRWLALADRWDEIARIGEAAVDPLFDILTQASEPWREQAAGQLVRLAEAHGASPAAERRVLTDAAARGEVCFRLRERCPALFSATAREYIEATDSSEAVRAFAERTTSPEWAAVAREWLEDAQGAPLALLIAERKISVSGHGSGISEVVLTLENHTDHEILVLGDAGWRCASEDETVQNMVTTHAFQVPVRAWTKLTWRVQAACANLHREIPGAGAHFEFERVAQESELARVLHALSAKNSFYGTCQAAVWILTDDATMQELRGLHTGPAPGQFGITMQLISPSDMGAALQVLHEAGVDVRAKRIWRSRAEILGGMAESPARSWLEGQL